MKLVPEVFSKVSTNLSVGEEVLNDWFLSQDSPYHCKKLGVCTKHGASCVLNWNVDTVHIHRSPDSIYYSVDVEKYPGRVIGLLEFYPQEGGLHELGGPKDNLWKCRPGQELKMLNKYAFWLVSGHWGTYGEAPPTMSMRCAEIDSRPCWPMPESC